METINKEKIAAIVQPIIMDAIKERKSGIRVGQEAFNTAYDYWPYSTNTLRGTQFDPFYSNNMDDVDVFIERLINAIYATNEITLCQ